MKLLFVHERFGDFGGAETNLLATAQELTNRGYSVGLLHGEPTGLGEERWRKIFPDRFSFIRKNPDEVVSSALQKFGPDLIYLHKLSDLESLEALLASRPPTVRMVHDHDLYCMRSYKYHPLTRTICRRPASAYCVFPCGAVFARRQSSGFPIRWVSYRQKRREIRLNQRCQRMIVATRYMREELVRNGFSQERIEVHPPVPARLHEEKLPSSPSIEERNLVLYAGQVIRGKGVDVLLESLSRVKVPFEAVIAGDGNHRATCEKLSRWLGLEDRVRFLGFLPQAELKSYFLKASLMVISSVWPEPFGAVGLEGMRYGLPVVAFEAGGIREWLVSGYNGYVVGWMDRAEFAARVEELLTNKALARQMGERGAKLAAQRFGFSDYISALENTFARVVAETQGKACS